MRFPEELFSTFAAESLTCACARCSPVCVGSGSLNGYEFLSCCEIRRCCFYVAHDKSKHLRVRRGESHMQLSLYDMHSRLQVEMLKRCTGHGEPL